MPVTVEQAPCFAAREMSGFRAETRGAARGVGVWFPVAGQG